MHHKAFREFTISQDAPPTLNIIGGDKAITTTATKAASKGLVG